MKLSLAGLSVLTLLRAAPAPQPALVAEVRSLIAVDDFATAEMRLRDYRAVHGATSEAAAAFSWMARATLERNRLDRAAGYAARTRELVAEALKGRSIDEDRLLATALGAAIEVEAQTLARRGELSAATRLLEAELARYRGTTLHSRIQKNINLLSLVGKPAPPLDLSQFLGRQPEPLAAQKGHPVLLFFWAHWCPDCKAMAPVLARLKSEYGSRGLKFYLPTSLYGYTKRGEEASPAEELPYIAKVRSETYPALADEPLPVSEENMRVYGSSSVPTLVLIDRQGIVRLYHPGEMTYEELIPHITALLR